METTYPLRRLAPYGGDAMNRILPDTLAYVSSWVPRSDLLALRVAFATGRDAVRRSFGTSHLHEVVLTPDLLARLPRTLRRDDPSGLPLLFELRRPRFS